MGLFNIMGTHLRNPWIEKGEDFNPIDCRLAGIKKYYIKNTTEKNFECYFV